MCSHHHKRKIMDKFINIFHIYQEREVEHFFSLFDNNGPTLSKNQPSSAKLWSIGLKLWGRRFVDREYTLRQLL